MYFGFALVKQHNFDLFYIALALAKPYFTFMTPPEYYRHGSSTDCMLSLLIIAHPLPFQRVFDILRKRGI